MHVTPQFHTRKTTWQVMVITNKLIYLIRREMNRRIFTKKWDVSTRKSSEEMKKEMIEVSMEEIRTFWNGVDRMYLGTSLHWLRLSLPPHPQLGLIKTSRTHQIVVKFLWSLVTTGGVCERANFDDGPGATSRKDQSCSRFCRVFK